MIIKFKDIDNYQINVSALNHTLEKQIIVPDMNVNTGKPNKFPGPKWIDVGFYPSVGQACAGLIKDAMLESDLELEVEDFQQWFMGMVKRVEGVKYEAS